MPICEVSDNPTLSLLVIAGRRRGDALLHRLAAGGSSASWSLLLSLTTPMHPNDVETTGGGMASNIVTNEVIEPTMVGHRWIRGRAIDVVKCHGVGREVEVDGGIGGESNLAEEDGDHGHGRGRGNRGSVGATRPSALPPYGMGRGRGGREEVCLFAPCMVEFVLCVCF